MARPQNPNLEMLVLVVERLGNLTEEMVFLGGCATGLLITDPAAPPIRLSKDVDVIVQVVSYAAYYQLSEKLRKRGFKEDSSEGAPLCRWITDNAVLDVMPTDARILGFSNQWYAQAMENAEEMQLPSGRKIRLVSAPYFLITKLEAFDGRGGGDYLMSHDIEDIIAVIDGRPGIIDEIRQAESELAAELSARFEKLLKDKNFIDSISGHMPTDAASQARTQVVLGRIKEIVKIKTPTIDPP